MAAKGQQAKEALIQELLNYFGDRAFKYDKEIRVECLENGEKVQIKLALTAAKVVVEKDGDVAVPGAVMLEERADRVDFATNTGENKPVIAKPTEEEKITIAHLLSKLGL